MDTQYVTEKVEAMYGDLNLPKDYFDYVDNEVFVSLSSEEDENLRTLVSRVDAIMRQAYIYAYEERYIRLDEYRPWLDRFRQEYPYDEHFIARYDAVFDQNGVIKFVENNANTPGMQLESMYFSEWLTPTGYTSHANRIRSSILDFWRRHRDEKWLKNIAILTAYTFEEEDHLVCRTYAEILSEIFEPSSLVVGDIYDMHIVDGQVFVRGIPVDAILSYFPLEFFLTDYEFADDFFQVVFDGWCFLANPIESIILQDKWLFATIHEHKSKFSEEDQLIIEQHIPYTQRKMPDSSDGWIAKWRFGRYGREIYKAHFEWEIVEESHYIYQQYFEPQSINDKNDFLVFSIYTTMREVLGYIVRRQFRHTTDDRDNVVTMVYTDNTKSFIW